MERTGYADLYRSGCPPPSQLCTSDPQGLEVKFCVRLGSPEDEVLVLNMRHAAMDKNLYNACLHSLDQVRHLETRAEHGTYKLSPDEEYQAILKYQRQSRLARILQVRAQEMLLGAKSAREFRQRRKRDNQKLLQVLKDAWQEEQAKRKAALEVDYLNSCKGIGQSYDAAQLVAEYSGAIAEQKAKEAEVNELCGNLRFQRAMQEENARKQEVSQERALAKGRRKVLSEAAKIERRRARIHACHARSDARDEGDVVIEEEVPEKYLKIESNKNDIRPSTIQSRLPGAPSDYKDTYFHSRFSVLNDRDNRGIIDAVQSDKEAEVDAWEAAEAQMKDVEKERERKAELEELWKRRKAERGQAAAARLQKIALLEKELAVELEEEQERKHQLQIIEDLTKAVRTPEYKRETWRHLQPTLVPANKELDRHCETKTEEGRAGPPEVEDAACATESKVLHSARKQLLHKGREGVPVVVLSSVPVISDEISADDLSSERKVEGTIENKHEAAGAEYAESKVTKTTATKEEQSFVDIVPSFHPSQCKVPGLSMAGLSRKLKDKDGDSLGLSGSALLPCCTPGSYSAVGGPKATKDAKSSSNISSLPHVSRKSGVRKGNKSPQKYEGERAPRTHEDEEAAAYIKEFKVRTTVAEKDQARPSVNSVGEFGVEKAVFPAIARAVEGCTTEARKKSPRKETSNWLSNILENFPWWNCDSSSKEFSCPGVRMTHEKMDSFRKSGELTDRIYGLENVGRINTPRTKHNEESSQDVGGARKYVPFRLETLGSLNTLRDTDWYCEEQPGWSEARTKVVFTKDELESLKLELYGTLTGETITSHQKKVILGKEKAKQGPRVEFKPQGLNPLLLPLQVKEQIQKTRSIDEESDQQSRSQTREERLEHPRSPTPKPDKTKSATRQKKKISKEDKAFQDEEVIPVACPQQECYSLHDSQPADERDGPQHRLANKGEHDHDKKPSTKDCATQYDFAEFLCMPKQKQGFSKESVEKEVGEVQISLEVSRVSRLQDEADRNACWGSGNKVQTPVDTSVQQRETFASSESNLSIKKGKASNELGSAREVAEELIRAWRAGQIGGDIRATFRRAKQVSRKRRATTVEDGQQQVSTSYSVTTQKLGQLREKINRAQQNSATKLRKWDVLTPPHGGESQGKRMSEKGSASRSQDMNQHAGTLRKVLSPPKASNQHCKEECSRVLGKRFSEEAMDRQVEDIVPEARSLDFILGSLSAQVRELDERLQNVTACSIGTTNASFHCTPDEREEHKAISGFRDPTSLTSADKVSQVPGRSWSHRQCSTGEDSETVKPLITVQERERINRAKNVKAAPVNPPKSPLVGCRTGCNLSSSQKQQDKSKGLNSAKTRFGGSIPSSRPQVQSPVSSSGICLEDMAELMQEMNGSPACQEMRAQLLQDSFLENLPRRRVSGTVNTEQEDSEPRCAAEKYRKSDASPESTCQSRQEEAERASNFSLGKSADVCSRKCEPAILDGLGALDTDKRISDGITFSSIHAVTRSPSQQPEGIPRSSLDLEDAMKLDGNEEYLLLSSSVDFSPWSTANLPDIFTTIADVGKGLNYIIPLGPVNVSKDGGAKLEHCHVKESSKYLLKNHEFKRKCRAFEKKRLGRGKGKLKKSARKPFNPLALPPKRVLSSKCSTRSVRATPQPGAPKFSKRDVKLTTDSRLKSKLTSRSLPEHFQKSVAADEVQKWLHKDATSCLAGPPDQYHGGRSVVKYGQSPGTKKFEGLAAESVARPQGTTSPPLVMTTPEVDGRQPLDRESLIKRDVEARRRPSSAGIVLSRR